MADWSEFVDVDFPSHERYVAGYSPRFRARAHRLCAGRFEDAFEIVPHSQWKSMADALEEFSLADLITRIFDQGQEGSCVGNAGTQAHQVMQAAMVGLANVTQMSAVSLYKQIGSSPNSGASVDDAIDRLGDTGILPLDNDQNRKRFKHVFPATGFYSHWPDGWKETAGKFKGLQGHACQSVEEMMSALLRGMPVHVGRAGHSILYVRPRYDGSSLVIDYVNSWSEDWGFGLAGFKGGFGTDTARLYDESADWCYAYGALDPSQWTWLEGSSA